MNHAAEWCPACCRPLERQTGLAAFVCVKGHTLVTEQAPRTLEDVRRERADGRARLRNERIPAVVTVRTRPRGGDSTSRLGSALSMRNQDFTLSDG